MVWRCSQNSSYPNSGSTNAENETESTGLNFSISRPTEATTSVSSENAPSNNSVLKKEGAQNFTVEEEELWSFEQDESAFKRNLPFFQEKMIDRLRTWKEVLINATNRCAKLNYISSAIAAELETKFVVFRAHNVAGEDESDYGKFLTLETFHPVLMRQKKNHDLVSVAYMSILELWPLLVLCFSCAALSGMIIWLLDHRSNPETFSSRFWKGIADGMWWAIVTMTTVGYGDKAPKSWFSRLFAVVWMIAGIVLLSMFTAQIGVPPGLLDSNYVEYEMSFSLVEEIDDPINSASSLKGLDSTLVFHCNDKEDDGWEALKFLPLCDIGAAFLLHPDNDDELPMDIKVEERFFRCLKSKVRSARINITELRRNKNREGMKSHSCKKFLQEPDTLKFQFKWVYFSSLSQYLVPFGALMGAIVLAFIFGSIYDFCCRENKKRKSLRKGANSLQSHSTQVSLAQKSGDDHQELDMVKSKV
ncbi:hypothetical protein pdam_00015117 [Pocillopora damicornis]|uniref:Potassium channel domain-containing protein n=1 Tax=Pocillopora damicornis TaxID=46731 RepID=A0A3M6U282_POCDA|nr:hypothetical protein pdam_00015117 [Pocillopora damicornis]